MKARADGTLQSVKQALSTRMHGQLSRGDSIGVWTFNEQLYTGRFPLQDWVPDQKDDIIDRVSKFLQEQKYEKRASLDSLMPTLGDVVKNSPFITIVLVSAGKDDLHGSPFDTQINQAYARWRTSQEKARMPMVTVLRAQRGKFIYHSVSPAPTDIALSELPPEPPATKTPPKKPAAVVTQKTPQTVLPPLIVSGKKPTTEPVPLAPGVSEAKSSPEAVRNAPATIPGPTAISAPAIDTRSPISGSTAMLAAVPATNSAPKVAPSVVAPPPNTVESVTVGAATTALPKANLTASSQPSPGSQTTETRAVVVKTEHTVATLDPSVINPQGTSPAKTQTFAEAAPSATTEQAPSVQQAASSPTTEKIAAAGESKSAPLLSWAFLTSKSVGLAIGAVLALGIVLLIISLRRAKAESVRHVSLITRSLNRGPNRS